MCAFRATRSCQAVKSGCITPIWPGRTANPSFRRSSRPARAKRYIEAGTLLGYQGNYSGTPGAPVGVHLHISVVKDDGFGHFKNELDIENTYDPSPYFGLELNANRKPEDSHLWNNTMNEFAGKTILITGAAGADWGARWRWPALNGAHCWP